MFRTIYWMRKSIAYHVLIFVSDTILSLPLIFFYHRRLKLTPCLAFFSNLFSILSVYQFIFSLHLFPRTLIAHLNYSYHTRSMLNEMCAHKQVATWWHDYVGGKSSLSKNITYRNVNDLMRNCFCNYFYHRLECPLSLCLSILK